MGCEGRVTGGERARIPHSPFPPPPFRHSAIRISSRLSALRSQLSAIPLPYSPFPLHSRLSPLDRMKTQSPQRTAEDMRRVGAAPADSLPIPQSAIPSSLGRRLSAVSCQPEMRSEEMVGRNKRSAVPAWRWCELGCRNCEDLFRPTTIPLPLLPGGARCGGRGENP